MKKTHSTVLSSLVLSGAVLVLTPQAWSQTGAGSQKSSEPSSSSSDMQTQKDQSSTPSRRAASGRMSKDKVKEVQSALKSKGMDPGPEDGVLGPKTQQALREFQKSNNLPATGRIDDKTASALGVDVSSSGMGSSAGMGSPPSGKASGASSATSGKGTSSGTSAPGTEPPGSGPGASGAASKSGSKE